MTEFDPDAEVEPEDTIEEEVAEEAPEQSSNRTFILVALGLGGLFVIGLICIAIVAFVVLPSRNAGRDQTATAIAQNNSDVLTQAVLIANPATETPVPTNTEPPTATSEVLLPSASDTPVLAPGGPTDTPVPTNTSGPSPTPSRTPTRIGGGGLIGGGTTGTPGTEVALATTSTEASGGGEGATATPTRIVAVGGATATKTATTSGTGGGINVTFTPTPTALPDTGFADNVGGPGLFIAAILLIVVLFFARQLRLRNS